MQTLKTKALPLRGALRLRDGLVAAGFRRRGLGVWLALSFFQPVWATDELDALFSDEVADEAPPAASSADTHPAAREPDAKAQPVVTLPVAAQSALPSAVKPERRTIDEIVVTAQKTEQSLQDVPISVSAFDESFLADTGVTDIGELVQYTANVKFDDSMGYAPVLSVRGFGTPPLGRGLEPSVGLVIDDIFYGRSTYTNDAAFDIQRVEVLRGPQGTLFGKNTIAGVMNFVTRDPDFDNSQNLSLSAGLPQNYRLDAARSITLVPNKLALRLSGRHRSQDSHAYNTARDEQNGVVSTSLRGKLLWQIDESSDLLITAWASHLRSVGLPLQLKTASEDSLAEFRTWDPEVEAEAFNDTLSMDRDTFADRDTSSVDLKFTRELLGLDMVLNLAWSAFDAPFALDGDFSPVHFIDFGTLVPDHYSQTQLEWRVSGAFDSLFGWGRSLEFLFGVFAGANSFTTSVIQKTYGEGLTSYAAAGAFTGLSVSAETASGCGSLGLNCPTIADVSQFGFEEGELQYVSTDGDARGFAIFNQFTWFASESINATLGWRYGQDRREGRIISQRSDTTVIAPVVTGQENFDALVEGEDSDFAPKLALSWQPSEAYTVYASVTKGFKSGGFASGVFNDDNLTFEPEQATAFELGAKTKLLDGSLMLNGSIYYTQYRDLQVRNFDGRSIFVTNAADATARGMEIDLYWLPPLNWLTVGGSFGLVDAVYKEYLCAPAPAGADGGSGHAVCFDDGSGDPGDPAYQDLSGEPLAFAPRLSGSLYSNLSVPLFEGALFFLAGVDLLYQGEHFIDTDNDPEALQPATRKLNARIGLRSGRHPWTLLLSGKNLSGAEESALVLDQASLPGNYLSAARSAEPLLQLELRWDWN